MPHRQQHAVGAVVGLAVAGMCGFSCASILGVDDYKVSPESSTATGASASTGTTSSTAAGGSTATTGPSGSGGATGTSGGGGGGGSVDRPDGGGMGGGPLTCSGATPEGTRMCGPGRTCLTRGDCANGCFPAGSGSEGSACTLGTDCSVGMTCIQYSASRFACRALCTVDAECPTGYRCVESFTCNAATAGRYCARLCSDVTAAASVACAPGFKCDFACDTPDPTPTTCDWEAGILRSGACTAQKDCAIGYNCISSLCTQTCRTNADCTTGGACTGTIVCGTTPTNFHYCI